MTKRHMLIHIVRQTPRPEGNATCRSQGYIDEGAFQPALLTLALVCTQSIHTFDTEKQSNPGYAAVVGDVHVYPGTPAGWMGAGPIPLARHRRVQFVVR